jgi:hypothetical protein
MARRSSKPECESLRHGVQLVSLTMLFVDEAPLPSAVKGASAFTTEFPSKGPRDKKGRSLRDLDLTRRLLRYPCSYMIYNETFEALPPAVKGLVYERMWGILSGAIKEREYSKLSLEDRHAIIEILRETKPGLPDFFTAAQKP